MSDYFISTDSTYDMPESYREEHNLLVHPLFYTINDSVYGGEHDMDIKEFYARLRKGEIATTMATNLEDAAARFRAVLERGGDILHIGFSSALSSSYNNAAVAAAELQKEFPERKIRCIDSLCASMGQGLLVHYAVQKRAEGMPIDELADWLEENKLHFCHQFTVDDLHFLQRGGRISKTVAVLGTMINVKPVLHVDNEGRLVPLKNVRGRRKALTALVDNMAEQIPGFRNDTIFISHGDCEEDARFVGKLVSERFGITDIRYNYVSPTIGSHSGPGTVALFFVGKER
ncbi:MAG: DegV family protein [Lachnospiraceae bacterium]|nr:DegV family protein [Lachnospiraceae bacterium]